jgi:hypothetical protein
MHLYFVLNMVTYKVQVKVGIEINFPMVGKERVTCYFLFHQFFINKNFLPNTIEY